MSIHVTVNADPVCVRRGLMLSDLEQIKKYERGRRRRLRLEQVRQQSKSIASKILEQTKNIARRELHNLENNEDSKLKRMHEQKIMEIQRRYQEDMEDIGMAHKAAQSQPDPDAILQSKKLKNQIVANERGKEAAKRIKEAAKADDEQEKHQERLRQVREIEDIRSSMISNLPKKIPPKKQNEPEPSTSSAPPQSSVNPTIPPSTTKTPRLSPKKRKVKKNRSKISPNKPSPKSRIKIVSESPDESALPQRIQVEVHREQEPESNPSEIDYIQVPCNSQCYRKDDSDLENLSNIQISSNKPDKSSRYNPSDYQNDVLLSSNGSSLSSLISDDSSYFSDRPTPTATAVTSDNVSLSKHHPSLKNSEVQVYDHITRQRNSYNHPEGIVEREDIQNSPNAEEMARRIVQLENNQVKTIDKQRSIARKRGNDAILREKVRRDYHNLMKNLDHLTREERKLKATQINNQQDANNFLDRSRRKDLNEIRQRKMERAFENIQNNVGNKSEAVITIHSNTTSPTRHVPAWKSPQCDESNNNNEEELSREEQILEMLKKVERQKRLLLQEFGSTLPNDILSATTTPLFNESRCEQICRKNLEAKQTTASPEIEVIEMSKSREKKSQKGKKKVKKTPKVAANTPQPTQTTPTLSTSEIAIQTQIELETDKNIVGEDKSIQVELSPEVSSRRKTKGDTSSKNERPEHIEPVVTIITHGNGDVSSVNSSDHGIVINVGRGRVEVTPRKSQRRIKTRSLPSSEYGSPIKRLPVAPSSSTSAPASRAATPDQNHHNSSSPSSSTTHVESASDMEPTIRNVNTISTQYSRVTEVSVGTDSSHSSPNEVHDTSTKPYVLPGRRIKYKETSDTSTSYASLPPISRQTHDEGTVSNITSILELVDSSGNETITRMRANVSPVSTPETPSPRTMRIPSNLPNAMKVTRILTFDEKPEVREVDSTYEDNQNMNTRRVIRKNTIYKRADMPSCECSNPQCKKYQQSSKDDEFDVGMHENQLEALKQEEELQNSCTEKIASLTAMIERIRDENSGIEFSMFAPSDDTSLMQMPEPRRTPGNGVAGLQNLVENIEQVHNRLREMLTESQNTFMTRRIRTEEISLSPVVNDAALVRKDDVRRKPRIVSDERVHFDIRKIRKVNAGSQAIALDAYQSDDGSIVEKLSQEILEQSKDVEKSMQRDLASEKTPEKSVKLEDNEEKVALGYSPMLADLPKIVNKGASTPFGNGQPRTDTKFVRPELSTIDEQDTTDTANRSQASAIRSPSKQSRQQTPRQSNGQAEQQPQQSSPKTLRNSSNSHKNSSTTDKERNDKHTSPISILKDTPQHPNQRGDTGENLPIEKSVKSPDSFLTRYSTRNSGAGDFFNQINIKNAITEYETQIKCEKITSSSSHSLSGFSGISEILTSTSLDSIAAASPPENMEFQLKKLGLSWLIPIAKKTRKASALSSSSNSDTTLTINKRTKSSVKKFHDGISCAYLDFSDVSSISIREASKSTEKTVLMKARTSTPNIPNFYCTSDKSNLTTTSTTSGKSLPHDYSDSLISKTLAIH